MRSNTECALYIPSTKEIFNGAKSQFENIFVCVWQTLTFEKMLSQGYSFESFPTEEKFSPGFINLLDSLLSML